MTPEERKDLQKRTEEAIKNHGFMGANNRWNAIITFPGDDRLYRERVETIIVRHNKEVFVKRKPNGEYFLPGGSVERNVPNIKQAENECNEEAHVKVKNIQFTGITYKEHHETPNWAIKEGLIQWQGSYTEVYTAEYDGSFKGNIAKTDEDPFIRSGKWYSTKECFKFFKQEHRDALKNYLKEQETKEDEDSEVTESYLTNYFGNRRLLRKLNKAPEVDMSFIDTMISKLKERYSKGIRSSKIKREMKRKDVGEFFHPVLTFDFPDGDTVTVCICYDKSSITDGAATRTDNYGDLIIIYPSFFEQNKDGQVFTLLHEMGHIRLHHIETRHTKKDAYGNDITNEHRLKLMNKGKVMYPEVYADFYAVLNGASMYAILDSAIKTDKDDEYDYRFTNRELAERYNQVWDKYKKFKGKKLAFESPTMPYDAACMAIYEMVYQNDLDLDSKEKKSLYALIKEYAINKKITNHDIPIAEAFTELYEPISKSENPIIRFSKEKEHLKHEIYNEMMNIKDKLLKNVLITENQSEIVNKYLYLLESLPSRKRDEIPTKKFGIPELRKYPLDSKRHVIGAIRLFGHCEPKYQKELAHNIWNAISEYDIPIYMIGPKSKLREYM